MLLFAGLGNPGAKYAANRHNVGFMALDRIAETHGFGPWRGRFRGQYAEGRLGGEKVLLLKPETYMNLSGESVGEAMRFYKLEPGALTVFHDELDLPPGRLRVKTGGGHGGHNGLRSIEAHLGADFRRVRIGIGHPGHKDRVTAWVLGDFPKAEKPVIDETLAAIAEGAPELAAGREDRFMNAFARQTRPEPARQPAAKPEADVPKSERQTAKDAPRTEEARSPLQRLIDRFR